MKRIVSLAAVAALSAASVSAFAQDVQLPQPSFNDNAPIQASAGYATTSAKARQALPQPSFNDNAPIIAGGETVESPSTATAAVPAPSFNG